ncbi:Hypothetical protein, putative [Bodo saltans]|uniref:Uncharacterized protein n=1 Tax=Bodo saltans TaxID=75058 RepID=A0A0S4IY81_BODSA|nr:Hypothetical protein, putative [Bodo saltans]|eukprot:CUG09267.1 Hypothetical protein, putative [Bodo saltans]
MLRLTRAVKRFNPGLHSKSQYKNGFKNRQQPNQGALTPREMGDPFADPSVYRSTTDFGVLAKLPKKMRQLRTEESMRRHIGATDVSDRDMMALDRSGQMMTPTHSSTNDDHQQRQAKLTSGMLNRKDLGLGEFQPRAGRGGQTDNTGRLNRGDFEVTADVIRGVQQAKRQTETMMARYPQAPSGKEYYRLFREHLADGHDDLAVEQHQSRLVEEHGIYPTRRIDAYMLDDDASVFPQWVNELPYSVRDRVKYGNMGLTEEDEALRVRLGRLSMDQRAREWERLKKAKEYLAAKEERVSHSELRDAREGTRRFHWLQRKRQLRASALRRLALRKPDEFEAWPSEAVDYSRRLGVIAQHVENGVATNGQWPLDEEELAKAKLRRRQEHAERTFLKSDAERKLANGRNMSGNIARTLAEMDSHRATTSFTRLSRKQYANRVNAVKHGDQDVHGRNYQDLARRTVNTQKPFGSIAEMALHNELTFEPRPHVKNPLRRVNAQWERHHQEDTYNRQMPNFKFGS